MYAQIDSFCIGGPSFKAASFRTGSSGRIPSCTRSADTITLRRTSTYDCRVGEDAAVCKDGGVQFPRHVVLILLEVLLQTPLHFLYTEIASCCLYKTAMQCPR